jgi:hypothetical protein
MPGYGQVALSWIVPSSDGGLPIYSYVVQGSTDGGRTWRTWSSVPATNRFYAATGLTNGATYQFRVAARNALGDSRVSNIVTATPQLMRPWPPRSLTATPGDGEVALSWIVPSSDGGLPIYSYVVQGSTDGGLTWRTWSSVPATDRSYTATGLTNEATYQFRVAARNALGDSRVSNIVSATPTSTALLAATAAEEPTTTIAPTTTVAPTTTTPITATSAPSGDIAAATIGDIVWVDADGDGLQDPGETGLEGVDVALLDSSGVELGRDTTDQFGRYEFAALAAGSYLLELELPDGYAITGADQGFDDDVDSDLLTVDEQLGTARTDVFGVPADRPGSVDLGLVVVEGPSGESTTTSSEVVSTAAPPDTGTPTTASTTTEPPPTEPPTTTAAPTTVAATTAPTTTLSPTTTVATGG